MTRVHKIIYRAPKKLVATLTLPAAVLAVWFASPRIAALVAFVILIVGLLVLGLQVADMNRALTTKGRRSTGGHRMESVLRLEDRLRAGFAASALPELERLSTSSSASAKHRARAFLAIAKWHGFREDHEQAYLNAILARAAHPPSGRSGDQPLFEADFLMSLGRCGEARRVLEQLDTNDPDVLIRLASTYPADGVDEHTRLARLNQVFLNAGFAPIGKRDPAQPLGITNIRTAVPPSEPSTQRLKVSVVMPCYNAEDTIALALRSLRDQTWTNLEIIVVDDGSNDHTAKIAAEIADEDSRIRVIEQGINQGAYVARNVGVRAASGDLITVQDADDWAHAQKIETQALMLASHPRIVANTTFLTRVAPNLTAKPDRPKLQRLQRAFPSLMLRRRVIDEIGLWDEVRASADGEYLYRMRAYYGVKRMPDIASRVPFTLALVVPGSLTSPSPTGLHTLWHAGGARKQYRTAYTRWHSSEGFAAQLPWFPDRDPRPFPCPPLLQGSPADLRLDVVVVANLSDDVTAPVADIKRRHFRGESVGLLHHPRPRDLHRAFRGEVWNLLEEGEARLLSAGEQVSCEYVVVWGGKLGDRLIDGLPELGTAQVTVDGDASEDAEEIAAQLRQHLGDLNISAI